MRIRGFLFGLIVLAAAFAACEDLPTAEKDAATVSAKIDGVIMTVNAPSATRVTPPGTVTIAAVAGGDDQAIYLNLKPTGTGTMSLGSGQNSAAFHKAGTQYLTALSGNDGTVKITRFDTINKVISGTFSFIARSTGGNEVVVTDGAFTNVKWSEQ